MRTTEIRAVFWDFGGVILSSPFDAFNDYERAEGLPIDFIRSVNAVDPDTNAWARIERREIGVAEFDQAFSDESHRLGHRISGAVVLDMLSGAIRTDVVTALDRVIEAGFITACLTNNVMTSKTRSDVDEVMARFHHVIESRTAGCRKPEREFYELACAAAEVDPIECVFLDDLGVNLKPARTMGMTTIKVTSGEQAISDLELVLEIPLR
jgi:putative hydrolase of the HAD superfamily